MSLTRSLSKRSTASEATTTTGSKPSTPARVKRAKKMAAKPESDAEDEGDSQPVDNDEKSPRARIHTDAHIRDSVLPISLSSFSSLAEQGSLLKIISWNVNGLKTLVNGKKETLDKLIATHSPDILCLQETKIQETMIDEYRDLLPGFESFWSCSTVKKGYASTAVFVKKSTIPRSDSSGNTATVAPPKPTQKKISSFFSQKSSTAVTEKQPSEEKTSSDTQEKSAVPAKVSLQNVFFDFENVEKKFAGEGRTIVLETDKFFLVACYVPNSGEGLVRLDYRVDEWDPFVREYLRKLNANKPVIYTGDLNVGHLDLDIHNPTAKHIVKQAGLTPRERESFSTMFADDKFRDAFRFFYPHARGQFTYWSQRTFARPVNKGIRLDYFVCSADMFPAVQEGELGDTAETTEAVEAKRTCVDEKDLLRMSPVVVDSYILHADTVGCSDHCPVVLVVKV